ncbi:MAG: NADPH:quinone reductase, partial [Vicinamibacterales bacterium]
MKAILVQQFGGPEVLQLGDAPEPAVGPGQIRVRVHAAGVNPYDTYMRAGGYAMSPPLPYSPGADAAGVIDAVGEGVTGWKAGDRVYTAGTVQSRGWGAYAEQIVCHAHQVHPLPDRLSFAQGAGVNVPYVTAWRALFGRAQAQPGETVFVHGASGGVGLAATQIARGLGMTVIGTASTPEGREIVQQQGAHHVLNHRDEGYLQEVTRLSGGTGPDV